jgi:squalene-hopene/tetraprenyl-beta-curcumene cyclase
METKKCDSCHQVPFMIWSLNAAADRGIAVDSARLNEWNEWARDWRSLRGRDKLAGFTEEKVLQGSVDEVAQLLLGRGATVAGRSPDDWLRYRNGLLAGQQPDGSWKPGGQLPGQKRSLRETQEATTLWALVAIASLDGDDDSINNARQSATKWLGTATVGESTEWWTARLLWEQSRGDDSKAEATRKQLVQSQHEDGGWGWLLAEESDALGTGIALYGLIKSGSLAEDPAVRRGIDFLVKTQSGEGSWPVKGTKQNKRTQVEPTATYWGTCWAVIALSESLPARQ